MTISKTNIIAKYYAWIYQELPKDLCSFFWGSLFAITLFPFFAVGRIVDRKTEHPFLVGIFPWMVLVAVSTVGNGIAGKLGYELYGFWGKIVLGAIIGAVPIAVGFGLLGLGVYFVMSLEDSKPKLARNISDTVGVIRGKYCTKINWK